MSQHETYMQRAIELAQNNLQFPFGAVIVSQSTGEILAEGWNQASLNPTWHGEMVAINHLFEQQPEIQKQDLTLYTTAEPCPMCQSAILWAGFSRVVFGTSIMTLQELGWDQIGIYASEVVSRSPFQKCEIIGGVLEEQCNALFKKAN